MSWRGGKVHPAILVPLLGALLTTVEGADVLWTECNYEEYGNQTVYDFTIPDISETRNISLADYQGKQEPGGNGTEILNGVKYVRPGNGFEPNFQLSKKIEVNGENEHPLFTFLKKHCPSPQEKFADKNKLFYNNMHVNDIRWNWEKFLISKSGRPVIRFAPKVDPMQTADYIQELLTRNDL